MQIIKKDLKHNLAIVKVENMDDLWYLSHIIEPGDLVSGKTERKIKIGETDARNMKVVKKWVFMKIRVEKLEFHKYSNILRVSGTVEEGPEDVAHGSYHTFNVEEQTVITITKTKWLSFQIEKLDEAAKAKPLKILVLTFDREEAYFAMLKNQGHEILSSMKGDVAKKDSPEKSKGDFYKELVKQILDYDKRYGLKNIIIASPSFWKEYLMKEVPEELKSKITLATCSSVNEKAIDEIIKRPELKQVLEQDKIAQEIKLIDALLQAISNNQAGYGLKEVSEQVNNGNIKDLFVTDNFIHEKREENRYAELDALMKTADNVKGKIHIISSDEGSKKLDGLGGIACILRWKA
ncbi:MAG: mRNA surveillance protein pelota [archaeon]